MLQLTSIYFRDLFCMFETTAEELEYFFQSSFILSVFSFHSRLLVEMYAVFLDIAGIVVISEGFSHEENREKRILVKGRRVSIGEFLKLGGLEVYNCFTM